MARWSAAVALARGNSSSQSAVQLLDSGNHHQIEHVPYFNCQYTAVTVLCVRIIEKDIALPREICGVLTGPPYGSHSDFYLSIKCFPITKTECSHTLCAILEIWENILVWHSLKAEQCPWGQQLSVTQAKTHNGGITLCFFLMCFR